MSQQYSLRWNNHQPNFISMFTTLLNTQTLVDVTLAAEGKHLQAHKVVLSACSTYFQALFVENPSRHPIVILKDVTFADLRTMVDFMYYGEVNVTEQQLPQVLDTAKLLKIKGLTEMPDSTSLTRSQGTSADFQSVEQNEPQRLSATPPSPSIKRRRRRKSSTGSTSVHMVDESPEDNQTVELVREGVTLALNNMPRRRDYHEERQQDSAQQTTETHNMNMDAMAVENNANAMAPGGQWSMMEHTYPRYSNACIGGSGGGSGGGGGGVVGAVHDPSLYMNNVIHHNMEVTSVGRSKVLKRQERIPEASETRLWRHHSEPNSARGPQVTPMLFPQHASFPQPRQDNKPKGGNRRVRMIEVSVNPKPQIEGTRVDVEPNSFLVPVINVDTINVEEQARASHTPAIRSGPPLSCNYCWNTVDEAGRILRRKTQYHCPECKTNLCIVPCFHEYHATHAH